VTRQQVWHAPAFQEENTCHTGSEVRVGDCHEVLRRWLRKSLLVKRYLSTLFCVLALYGLAQIGKSFRNEITPRKGLPGRRSDVGLTKRAALTAGGPFTVSENSTLILVPRQVSFVVEAVKNPNRA
jgi:hypothetical protein